MNRLLVDGLHMMQLLLPGTPITYYADELGVQDTYIRWNQTVDPAGRNVGSKRYTKYSRDPARSPFPWDNSKNAGNERICIPIFIWIKRWIHFWFTGFTNGSNSWLPINPEYWHDNLVELSKNKTHLRTYRQLSNLRKIPTIVKGDLHSYILSKWVYGFSRYAKGLNIYLALGSFL